MPTVNHHTRALVPILTHEFGRFKCARADRYRAGKPPRCDCAICALKWQGRIIHELRYRVNALEALHLAPRGLS